MSSKHYDLAVVIGRFQPFHIGHESLIRSAFEQSDHVLVLVGSSFQAPDPRNPFTFEERKFMMSTALSHKCGSHQTLSFEPLRDYYYEENKWIQQVQEKIATHLLNFDGDKVSIVGHDKDDSTYYLKLFPSYDFIEAGKFVEMDEHPVDATQIRNLMFNRQFRFLESVLHPPTYAWLQTEYFKSGAFANASAWHDYLIEYIRDHQFHNKPYGPTHNTVDCVLMQGGHVLLIRRKEMPGKGLWALPGGFLQNNCTFEQSMLNELKEETLVKVPLPILKANITHDQIFDHPARSLRGRVVTNAYLIELPGPSDGKLPKVKGADDADKAKWFPISEVLKMSDVLFEDHHSIISMLTARAK